VKAFSIYDVLWSRLSEIGLVNISTTASFALLESFMAASQGQGCPATAHIIGSTLETKTLWHLLNKQTIQTERPPLFGHVNSKFLRVEERYMVNAADPNGR
jgi:hypothetical protein